MFKKTKFEFQNGTFTYVTNDALVVGDYVGDAVCEANIRVLKEEFNDDTMYCWCRNIHNLANTDDAPKLLILQYGFSAEEAWVREDVADILDGLDDYPLIDEMALSEIEIERISNEAENEVDYWKQEVTKARLISDELAKHKFMEWALSGNVSFHGRAVDYASDDWYNEFVPIAGHFYAKNGLPKAVVKAQYKHWAPRRIRLGRQLSLFTL